MTTLRARPFQATAAGLHPLHAVLVAWPVPLFLGALISDIAYARTYQIQWINFADWLVAGGLVFTGLALAWSLVAAVLDRGRNRQALVVAGLLLLTFLFGLLNAFQHARDAWATMPGVVVWSLVVTLLSIAAVALSIVSVRRQGDAR